MSRLLIAFRVDASQRIGTGHLKRCLTLAASLQTHLQCRIIFICRDYQFQLTKTLITKSNMELVLLPALESNRSTSLDAQDTWLGLSRQLDAQQTQSALQTRPLDWLISDHYGIDCRWQQAMQPFARFQMTIDDLANRQYFCDLLLDQSFGRQKADYAKLAAQKTQLLLGPGYALLGADFQKPKPNLLEQRLIQTNPNNILVNFGGCANFDLVEATIDALTPIRQQLGRLTFVLGAQVAINEDLDRKLQQFQAITLGFVDNMAELLQQHDIAIGAAGGTSWERCAMAVPSLCVAIADNQQFLIKNLVKTGAIQQLANPITPADLTTKLFYWLHNLQQYQQAVRVCQTLCDGQGADKVVSAIRAHHE